MNFDVAVTFVPIGGKTLIMMRMRFASPDDLARTEENYGANQGGVETLARLIEHVRAVRA